MCLGGRCVSGRDVDTGNDIGAAAAAALGEGLKENTSLQTLDLSCKSTWLRVQHTSPLVTHCAVCVVCVSTDNRLGDDGAAALAEMLRTNTSLLTLRLDGGW